jgi:catechol 2,3-dioxygenase-like lactoylglutathione lyase family enzyme
MIKALRIGHATFDTPDLTPAIDYYTQVVGLSVVARETGRAFLSSRIGQLAIELRQAPERRCSKLSFEVAPDLELAEMTRQLASHGVSAEVRSDASPANGKVVAFNDPKGTAIELFNEWRSLGNSDEAPGGVGALKLGHVAFVVHDPKAMAEFYAKVLGFRISDWIGDFFVFMRCNADHHAVNFITGKNLKMHHIAFELRDASHLQSACDLFGERKIPIIWGPVRLGPGHNVATFHRNSDDWVVEFYTELDQMKSEDLGYFDPRPWHRDRPQRPKVWDPKHGWVWGLGPAPDFFRDRA